MGCAISFWQPGPSPGLTTSCVKIQLHPRAVEPLTLHNRYPVQPYVNVLHVCGLSKHGNDKCVRVKISMELFERESQQQCDPRDKEDSADPNPRTTDMA